LLQEAGRVHDGVGGDPVKTWLVTGGTGFLGGQLLKELSDRGDRVFALARRGHQLRKRQVNNLPGVEWIAGDILNPSVIEEPSDRQRVLAETTGLVHAAALYDLEASHKDLYLCNVVGTHNVLHLAEEMPKLTAFHYSSTIAVAGNYSGVLTEDMFDVGQTFPDSYASTKFAAERAVRNWDSAVPRIVHRLGILLGHSETGVIPKIDGPYYLLRLLRRLALARGLLNALRVMALPFNEHTRLYMVPVDITAKAMVELMNEKYEKGLQTFHLTGDPHGAPIRTVLREMLEACGYDVQVLSLPSLPLIAKAARGLDVPAQTLFYMNSVCRYDNRRFRERLPKFDIPCFDTYSERILKYAVDHLLGGKSR
jgi:thioester reductase-like protein